MPEQVLVEHSVLLPHRDDPPTVSRRQDFSFFFFYDAQRSFKAAAAPLGPDSGGRKQVLVPSRKVNQRLFFFFTGDRYSEE